MLYQQNNQIHSNMEVFNMSKKTFTIKSNEGLHARPASALVKVAAGFSSEIFLQYGEKNVNLKSILGVMSLAVPAGGEITITATGSDEEVALQQLDAILTEQGLI